ncbi:MAG TPA: hypothetical protein DEF47_13725 [Herpetosiphon sp.]|uniref:Uncharacterized protein n=1 Tax=Herpetosiphon aurantiacus (strain ATCC 23779 / DSM 785 / 114-95) TaxID=316274 RepID=A9AZ17_HERA2|nr:hypothetical protein [Herpetosiphon sp.]ABX07057.1 hypothetical protein Haur_4425 [Herpetosiphon aurantiacus DSM 785]HBW50948.1 hypothetical protein [Herpetosiphon sp.]
MIPIRRVMSMLIVSSMMIGIVPSTPAQSTAPKAHPTANQAPLNDLLLDSDDGESSTLNVEADPCPEPAASLELPDLEPTPNQPQNASVKHTNQALPHTNYPLNCEFARDREVLAMINPESFSITNANQSFTTDSVTVPETTQMLRFEYMVGRKTADSITPLHIEVLSGANFATVTNISNSRIKSQYRLGWQNGALNIQAFRGQTIKLRFINDWWWTDQPSAQVRNIQLTQEIPDWELSTVGEFAIQNDALIGAHAVITGANANLTSMPINITYQTQSLSFNYRTGRWLNDGHAPLFVDILSGPSFTTVTRIDQGTLGGRLTDGWREAVVDVQAFRGQMIKIKIVNDWWPTEPQVTSLDRFMLNWAVPGWDISNASFVRTHSLPSNADIHPLNTDFEQGFVGFDVIENAAFEQPKQLVSVLEQTPINLQGIKTKATSIDFLVPAATTSVHFEYMLGDLDNPNTTRSLQVAILSGEAFEIRELPKGHEFISSQQAGWQLGKIDLVGYRGKTIKLQFTNASLGKPSSQIRQLQVMQDVPGWHVSNHQLVSFDTHEQYPNHVYVHGNATQLTSFGFTVPLTAQQVRFDYQAGHSHDNAARQSVAISVLSGDHFEVATLLPKNYLSGSTNQGWQRLAIDLQRFQGQTIKVRFQLEAQNKAYLRLDNFQVGQILAGWSVSEHTPISLESAGTSGQAVRFTGNNATITSDAWQVPTDTQTLQFNYKAQLSDPNARSFIKVHVLSTDDFTVITPIDAKLVYGTANNGWLQAQLDLAQFQGQTIKLQFKSHTSNDAIVWLDQLQLIAGPQRSKQVTQQAPDYSFIEMTQNAQQLTSSSVEVASDSQFLRFVYQVGNKDQGNARHYLAMEVLSGANFTTVTRIDQNQLRASLNDGWKIAQLPIQQFQNQTIKIRFVGPDLVSAPIVRIDKVALLSPRATLTNPIATTGTTYLNVPLTEFGGPTTTATMTITSLVVYDEYIDLAGEVYYGNTSYPFALTGDLYHSNLGTPGDVVAELQDTTRTFDALYLAFRQQPFGPQTNPSIINENLSLYLQRQGTREATLIDLGLNDSSNMLLNPIFQASSLSPAEYGSDYWFGKLVEPESTFEALGDPDEKKWTWTRRTIGEDCSLFQQLTFGVVVTKPYDIGVNEGNFGSQLEVLGSVTNGYVTPGQSWPDHSCDIYDEDNAGVSLGSKDDPVTVKFVSSGNGLTGNSAQGDYLSHVIFGGEAAIFKNNTLWFDQFMGHLITSIDLVSKFYSTPISVGDVSQLFPEGTPAMDDKPALSNSMILNDWDDNPNTKMKVLRVPFQQSVLVNRKNYFMVLVSVTCKKQTVNKDMQLKIFWHIPLYDKVTKKELNKGLYNKIFLIDYKSGPCNK